MSSILAIQDNSYPSIWKAEEEVAKGNAHVCKKLDKQLANTFKENWECHD